MRFKILTLVDITETKARRGDDQFLQKQQQNYLTALQTISLRANPIIKKTSNCETMKTNNIGFGKSITGTHNVWSIEFEFEVNIDAEQLLKDLDFVPIIDNLKETIKLKTAAFLTNGRDDRNTIIELLDK